MAGTRSHLKSYACLPRYPQRRLGGHVLSSTADTGHQSAEYSLAETQVHLLEASSAEEVATRLKEAVQTIVAGEVTVSLRDGHRLVVAATTRGSIPPPELYRSTSTSSYINHGLNQATLVSFLSQGNEVAGRLTAEPSVPITEAALQEIDSLTKVAAARILQIQGDVRLGSLVDQEREFLDRFAHDMKTPLTAILGMAQTLQRQDRLTPELRSEFLERIEASSRDLERIVEEGRAQLKAKSASLSVSLEECDLHQMLADAIQHARDGITVTIENFPGVPCVSANPEMLASVLESAVRHCTARAATGIRVEIGKSGEWVEVKITDDGPEPDADVYNDGLWYRVRQGSIGQTPGDPLELVAPARDLRVLGGKMAFETEGGRLKVVLVLPVASTGPGGNR